MNSVYATVQPKIQPYLFIVKSMYVGCTPSKPPHKQVVV